MAMPPSRPSVSFSVWFHFCGDVAQHAHRFARHFGADAVAGQNQNVQIHALVRRHPQGFLALAGCRRDDLFVHEPLLAMVGDRGEAVVQVVEFFAW